MPRHTKQSICLFRSSARRRSAEGMGMILVLIVATVLLVGLTAALPSVLQEGRREREAEVIYRGTQYARAVALFHRQFNRYPASVEELLETNGMRFLRQEYTDPLDPNGKWRFIHANAAGVILDSKAPPLGPNMPGVGGSSGRGMGRSGAFPQGSSPSTTLTAQAGSDTSPASSTTDNPVQGGLIIGVAPTSHDSSIRIWNKRDHYDEWEFLGVDLGLFGIQVGFPGAETPAIGPQSPAKGPVTSPGVTLPPSPASGESGQQPMPQQQ